MTAALATPRLHQIPRVELFAVGVHRDQPYSAADLDLVVRNFHRFAGANGEAVGLKINPPVCLGHSEEQALLEGSDLPAAGIVSNVWREGGKLLGSFRDVPDTIARLINQRAYRTVSAEFWPDLVDQGVSYGLTLRRVALLGGEVPQVKSLADLPLVVYADRRRPVVRPSQRIRLRPIGRIRLRGKPCLRTK
jgi:hypothetical protein